MSRRRRERALAPRGPEPVNHERALARFRCLVGRRVEIGFVPLGPVAQAESPRELDETFEEWLAAETSRQRPS